MTKPRQPCQECGAPKPPGSGLRFCDPCRDKRKTMWSRDSYHQKLKRADEARRANGVRKRVFAKDAPVGQKWCGRCCQYLGIGEFGPNGSKQSSYCRECYAAYLHARHLHKEYGLTAGGYDELLASQNGKCAICLRRPRKRRLAVDHDHRTGAIRGLLCGMCNQKILGSARDDVSLLRRAANYIERPPAITGEPLEALGFWDDVRLEAALDDAVEINGHKVGVVNLDGRECVVMTLQQFAELVAEKGDAS